jgi:hypothetical protein
MNPQLKTIEPRKPLTDIAAKIDAEVASNTSRLAGQWLRFAEHLTTLSDDIFAFPENDVEISEKWHTIEKTRLSYHPLTNTCIR